MPHIECRIRFDRQDLCFLSGELLTGQLQVVDTDCDIRDFSTRLELIGSYRAHWTQESRHWLLLRKHSQLQNDSKFYYNFFYADRDDWKNQGPAATGGRCRVMDFCMQLLKQLPTSCVAPHGTVQYVISVFLQGRTNHLLLEQPITIVRPLDPNEFQLYQKPWQVDLQNILSCRLRCCSFVTGQTVDFALSLGHSPAVALVHSINVKLQEVIVYMAYRHGACHAKNSFRHDLDEVSFHPRMWSLQPAKQPKNQPLEGSLRIPETTVPSSNYPIYPLYRLYREDMQVYHVIRITVRSILGAGVCEKRITICTRPHSATIDHDIASGSKQRVFSVDRNYFTCLPYDPASGPTSRAFIPKYSEAFSQQDIDELETRAKGRGPKKSDR